MRESDIMHENGDFWVARDKAGKAPAYVVYRLNGTHSVSDSAYERNADGLSIAIARCDYLARRAAPVRVNLANSPHGAPYATGVDLREAFPCPADYGRALRDLKASPGGFMVGGGASPTVYVTPA